MKLQVEQFVFVVICTLLALFLYTWAFCFDIPGYKEGTKRWDVIKNKYKEKAAKKKKKKPRINAPRLCLKCSKTAKRPMMVVLVASKDCIRCRT